MFTLKVYKGTLFALQTSQVL